MVRLRGAPNKTRFNIPEEEAQSSTRANIPKEEEHPSGSANIPEEEDYPMTRANIPEEEEHPWRRANVPGAEEHPRARANIPEEEGHPRSRANVPEKEEHPISSHENLQLAVYNWNPTHTRRRKASTLEKGKEHSISSHENMQPAAQEDVDQQMTAAQEGPTYSITMSTGVQTTDQLKGPSPESLAQPQLRDDTGKKHHVGQLTSCSTDIKRKKLMEIVLRKPTMEKEREEGEDLVLPRFNKYGYSEDEEEENEINGDAVAVEGENQVKNSSSSYQTPLESPTGDLEVMVGDVECLGVSMKDDKVGTKWKGMFDFMKIHNIEGSMAADMVLLNLPSGLPVSGVDDEKKTVPSWNTVTPSLILNGLLVASKILSDTGFLVCIHTYHQDRQVNDGALKCGLQRSRALVLISSKPIYYQLHRPHTKIHTLIVSLFHHGGKPTPRPYYTQAAEVESAHHECSLSRNSLEEDKAEFEQRADWRGGAERSHTIWRFLLQAFSKCGDTVVDLIAGSGSFVKIASELGRHAFGVDPHDHIEQTICYY